VAGRRAHARSGFGHGCTMSNSGEESEESTGPDSTPERGYISDEQLPEDLQPKKNPLARNPDDDEDDEQDDEQAAPQKVAGLPDMGEPGAT
jgi:hypothetical protein